VLVILADRTLFAQAGSAGVIIERSVELLSRDWNAATEFEYYERDREPHGVTKTFEDLMIF
jgi:hypothetical protein